MSLSKIRNINTGWLLILLGVGFIPMGLNMTSDSETGNTLLCFDAGCVTVQGYSCIALGIFMIGIGIYTRFF
jgi:hypothetical protein